MRLAGVCITTKNAPRLAGFYEQVLQEHPLVEGGHYGFNNSQLAIYDSVNVNANGAKNMSLMFYTCDLMREYERLLQDIPDIEITSPPERRPWGAFSFWFLDPEGNTVSIVEKT